MRLISSSLRAPRAVKLLMTRLRVVNMTILDAPDTNASNLSLFARRELARNRIMEKSLPVIWDAKANISAEE